MSLSEQAIRSEEVRSYSTAHLADLVESMWRRIYTTKGEGLSEADIKIVQEELDSRD